jgi:hypothetical protein
LNNGRHYFLDRYIVLLVYILSTHSPSSLPDADGKLRKKEDKRQKKPPKLKDMVL